MRARTSFVFGLITVALLGAAASLIMPGSMPWNGHFPTAAGRAALANPAGVAGRPYPGSPDREARLVQAENDRLAYVRGVTAIARWKTPRVTGPFRLRTGTRFTLVLPPRGAPYTFSDLQALAPDTLVHQEAGWYLLSESIVVLADATLSLSAPGGLDLRLDSGATSFVSIVTLGGNLTIAGSPSAPVSITSWNSGARSADTDTSDGRAYIRVTGGHAALSYAHVSDLGFWSGTTGGLAVTGTGRPGTAAALSVPVDPGGDTAAVGGARLLPPSTLAIPPAGTAARPASVSLDNVTIAGNAFGLFVANATGVAIHDTRISGSLVDGLVLHRFVSNAVITRTTADDNGGDGFRVGKACRAVVLTEVSATRNGRDGVSLNGRPLAEGPNASGRATSPYGDNRITGSTIADNARYGLKVSGGRSIQIAANSFANNDTGIVIDQRADGVLVDDNVFTSQVHQSIAVRENVVGAEITRNSVSGGDTGIYLRNSGALVSDNTIGAVSNHGISLVGETRDARIVRNSISGFGSAAVWTRTASGQTIAGNDVRNWQPAPTVEGVARSTFQPLTVVWLLLGLLLALTALIHQRPRRRSIRDPYGERVPLTSLSKGIVARSSLGGDR